MACTFEPRIEATAQFRNLNHPYSSSNSSPASSSASSIFSINDASSQASSVSSSSSTSSVSSTSSLNFVSEAENTSPESEYIPRRVALPSFNDATITIRGKRPHPTDDDVPVPADQRLHPRRTKRRRNADDSRNGVSDGGSARPPPSLVRQSDRKVTFVDNLVDSAAQIVEVIWPLSVVRRRSEVALGGKGVLPLRTFIQETLRRSRTSYSTLQVALYYLIVLRPHVPKFDFTMEQPEDSQSLRALQCGRRMFLAALILASKYLQDRNYSARAWSKISGLNIQEINVNEMTFLTAVNWKLHISEELFNKWADIVLKYTQTTPPPPPSPCEPFSCSFFTENRQCGWASVIPRLTPELDTIALNDDVNDELVPFVAMKMRKR